MNWQVKEFPSPKHKFILLRYAEAAGLEVWGTADMDSTCKTVIKLDWGTTLEVLVGESSGAVNSRFLAETKVLSWEEAIELLREQTLKE